MEYQGVLHEDLVYRTRNYPAGKARVRVAQDYATGPLLTLMAAYGGMISYRVARHLNIMWWGLLGFVAVLIISGWAGRMRAANTIVEIGFRDNFFYMRSAWDVYRGNDLKLYPVVYSSAAQEGDGFSLNYIDRTVRLRREDWGEPLHEIYMQLQVRS